MYLNCKTYFSFRYGTYSTEDLVRQAQEFGVQALALTNINNTCDAWDFVDYCQQAGIRPVLGAEIRNGNRLCYLLLARNNSGFRHINAFLSLHLQQAIPFPERPHLGEHVWVIYPFCRQDPSQLGPQELIGVQPTEIGHLYGLPLREYPDKYVVRQPVSFQDAGMYKVHRLLRAIDKNILISKQQAADLASPGETFMPPAALLEAFRQHPAILLRSLQVLDSCEITADFQSDKTRQVYSASREDDRQLLEKLAWEGLEQRYGKHHPQAAERLRKELSIIHELQFNAYFLITWDIVRYAQNRGFFYVGRGSGANSMVAYCLHITDVDPIELDLYFERFLNPHRSSPPDFDMDFSWKDRDEVIDYIFKRYGRQHVALLGSYTTFQFRAIVRELGKVFGLPKEDLDTMVRHPLATLKEDPIQRAILRYGKLLENFPNTLSIHACGMLVSEAPLDTYTAMELPPKGFPTTQIDMFLAEKLRLYKLDILSQRGLGHIRDAIQLVRENRGIEVDIRQVKQFTQDPQVARQIRDVHTIGCFYIESPAMRQLLKKLRCSDYLTLVAASSIIRPGVAQSGMMREYIYRFHHPEGFEYLHPRMRELLEETYGVMVYQEDVIKVAHHFAGLDLAEADVLRRAMSGKYRGRKEFEQIRDRFFTQCRERGYPETLTSEVWRQIESFGGYSFSKAHSASYAVESYQSLYLKTYFPMEFMVAVINNFGGFYSTAVYLQELKKSGAELLAPCLNNSRYLTHIRGRQVYLGLIHLQGLEEQMAHQVLEERDRHGPYQGLQDLMQRCTIPPEQLNLLIRIGALRFSGKGKKQLLWEANLLQGRERRDSGPRLFEEAPMICSLPALAIHALDDALDDMELLGFTLGDPFDLLDYDGQRGAARDLPDSLGQTVCVVGHLVTVKPVRTIRKELMHFGTFLDQHGDWLDTVHFPDISRRYPFQGAGFYLIEGKVVEEFGVYSLEAARMTKLGLKSRHVSRTAHAAGSS